MITPGTPIGAPGTPGTPGSIPSGDLTLYERKNIDIPLFYTVIEKWLNESDKNLNNIDTLPDYSKRVILTENYSWRTELSAIIEPIKYNLNSGEFKKSATVPNMSWCYILSDVTRRIQEEVGRLILIREKKNISQYKPELDIPYYFRRNFLEETGYFQQPGFNFHVVWNDKKLTLRYLSVWLNDTRQNDLLSIFLIMFLTVYLIVDEYFFVAGYSLFRDFWTLIRLETRQEARELRGYALYITSDWVFHPLTREEDDEYFREQVELEIIIPEKEKIAKKRATQLDEEKQKTFYALNMRIKILSRDVLMTLNQLVSVANTYTTLLSEEYYLKWNSLKERTKSLLKERDDILLILVRMSIYDTHTGEFDNSNVRELVILKMNGTFLLEICDKLDSLEL